MDTISRADVQDFVDGLEVGPWAKASTLRLLRAVLEEARDDAAVRPGRVDADGEELAEDGQDEDGADV